MHACLCVRLCGCKFNVFLVSTIKFYRSESINHTQNKQASNDIFFGIAWIERNETNKQKIKF